MHSLYNYTITSQSDLIIDVNHKKGSNDINAKIILSIKLYSESKTSHQHLKIYIMELSIYIKTNLKIGLFVVCVQIIHQKLVGKNSQLNTRSSL